MNKQRPFWPYLIMLLSAMYIWYLQQPDKLWLMVLSLISILFSYFIKIEFKHSQLTQIIIVCLLFGLSFLIIHGSEESKFVSIYSTGFIHPLVSALVLSIVYQWYSPRSENLDWLLFSIGGVLIFSTISWQVTSSRYILIGSVLIFLLAVILNQILDRHLNQKKIILKHSISGVIITLILVLGFSFISFNTTFQLSPGQVIQFIRNRLPDSQKLSLNWTSFTGQTVLSGQTKGSAPNKIVIKVETSQVFDHLRGGILTHYNQGKWSPPKFKYQPLKPNSPELHESSLNWFSINSSTKKMNWKAKLSYLGFYEGIIFMPLGTEQVALKSKEVQKNQYQIIKRELYEDFPQYTLSGGANNTLKVPVITASMLQENLQIPSGILKEVRFHALKITAGAKTDLEKAEKIEAWFKNNFKYTLNIGSIPSNTDPTVYFIKTKMPAFCSWFASGMTLMLRSINIPAHIVNGWLNLEYNSVGDFWVIREREAHAWVEVLDVKNKEWLTFDPTSPQQLEQAIGKKKSPIWEQTKDSLSLKVKQWLQWFSYVFKHLDFEKLFQALTIRLKELVMTPASWGVISLFIAFIGLFYFMKLHKKNELIPLSILAYSSPSEPLDTVLQEVHDYFDHNGIEPLEQLTLLECLNQLKHNQKDLSVEKLEQVIDFLNYLRYNQYEESKLEQVKHLLTEIKSEKIL